MDARLPLAGWQGAVETVPVLPGLDSHLVVDLYPNSDTQNWPEKDISTEVENLSSVAIKSCWSTIKRSKWAMVKTLEEIII